MAPVALLDVDGTLVDTNYHHALAWWRAFRAHGITLPLWRIHRHVGMGGDQLVPALVPDIEQQLQARSRRRAARSSHG
jgi:beta-phosphoglucomutase-like phosphatase (HAD superfamily)